MSGVDEARDALQQIIKLAGEVALTGGPEDRYGLRNRSIEIAAIAENLLWSVDPDASDWCIDLYERATGRER